MSGIYLTIIADGSLWRISTLFLPGTGLEGRLECGLWGSCCCGTSWTPAWAGLRVRISKAQDFMKRPCTWVSSDFDNTWSADRGWSKIITEVDLAAQNTLRVGKTGCQSGKNSFFEKSRFITFGALLSTWCPIISWNMLNLINSQVNLRLRTYIYLVGTAKVGLERKKWEKCHFFEILLKKCQIFHFLPILSPKAPSYHQISKNLCKI